MRSVKVVIVGNEHIENLDKAVSISYSANILEKVFFLHTWIIG